jgi:thiol-disulfide isomerase/thioredoxin
MHRLLRLAALALACFALAPNSHAFARASGDRTSAEIVGDVTVAQRALADAAKAGKTNAGYTAAAQQLCDFVSELWRVDPGHAQLPTWLQQRWSLMTQTLGRGVDADAEITKYLDANPNGPLDWPARASRVRVRKDLAVGRDAESLKALEAAFEDLAKRYADHPELADLFWEYADFRSDDPRVQAELLKRFVEKYPDHKRTSTARGRIVQLARLGGAFELEFKDALTGKAISMKGLRGKVVVVDFWATWCGPCMREMPHMKELYAKYKDQGVEILGVSLDRSEAEGGKQALISTCDAQGLTWPQYYQGNYWSSEFSSSWGIHSIPSVFLVDFEGKLVTTNARGKLDDLIPKELERARAAKK